MINDPLFFGISIEPQQNEYGSLNNFQLYILMFWFLVMIINYKKKIGNIVISVIYWLNLIV